MDWISRSKFLPKIGIFLFRIFCMQGFANLDVAAGSPGPLDRNTPSGLSFSIVSKSVSAGTTVTLHAKLEKFLKIFFLIPKSIATTCNKC